MLAVSRDVGFSVQDGSHPIQVILTTDSNFTLYAKTVDVSGSLSPSPLISVIFFESLLDCVCT